MCTLNIMVFVLKNICMNPLVPKNILVEQGNITGIEIYTSMKSRPFFSVKQMLTPH